MTVVRLLEYFVPSHYDLSLTLEGKERRFNGTVKITGALASAADHIGLHAKDLVIAEVRVDEQPATFSVGKDDELIIAKDAVQPGEHTVTARFSGTITDSMHGLYPCYYQHDGVKKELFATQFESHHAREVFPCIDEPAAKATFDLALTTAPGQQVLSNMPVKSQDEQGKQLITTFDTTPRMSTYLLAFVVGELHKKSASTAGGVEVNVWATPAQPAGSLDFALDFATRAIEFYDDYFGTPYPLPKCDHVALPDFSAGAMENWGLITYREICLLATSESSIYNRQEVAYVIAHELAHQWFGNLVTMQWWNDLWLNESFATLMGFHAVNQLQPQWDMWLKFAIRETLTALRRDSIDGVQAVQVDVDHPDQISTLFDGAIVYAKGARLMRMIQQYIGHDDFASGLKEYFTTHAYGDTTGDDLWDALEHASGKQVKHIMNTWISQPGYPVVSLERSGDKLALSQQQFFVGPHAPSQQLWPIPLGAGDTLPQLMSERLVTVTSDQPVRLNQGDSAHFITNYDKTSRTQLLQNVTNGTAEPIDRVQLLNESTLLARGGIIPSASLLPIIAAYKDETREPVWDIVTVALGELRKFVEDNQPAEQKLRQLAANLASANYARLGWQTLPGESEDDAKLRGTMLALTLYGEDPQAMQTAKKLYESTPLENIDSEIRSLVIGSVSRHGDGKVVDDLLAAYRTSQSVELRQDICTGITATRIPEKIAELLDTLKDPAAIRPQDVRRWFIQLIKNTDSRPLAWQWLQDNWSWIEATFAGDKSYDDFPRYSASTLGTEQQLVEYKAFFEPLATVPELTRTIAMGISEIEGRVELIARDKDDVQQALLS